MAAAISQPMRALAVKAHVRLMSCCVLAVQIGGIGIFQTDFERDRTRFSPELCNMLGLRVGTEMTFAQASQLFDESDRAAVQASVEAAFRSADRGKWSGVHRVRRSDGAVRWVSVHGRRI